MTLAAPRLIDLPADWSIDRDGQHPIAIIAHGTAGIDSRETLQHGGGRKVSIHVLIARDGTIYRMVPDERGANHAGAPSATLKLNGQTYKAGAINRATLGFELESLQRGTKDDYTEAQLASMAWQVAQWRQRYGPLPIFRHATIDPTRRADPVGLTVLAIEARIAALTPPPPAPPPDPWLAWGTAYPLDPAARGFAIPQAWLEEARWLGEARSGEVALAGSAAAATAFQGGYIVWERATNAVHLHRWTTRLR